MSLICPNCSQVNQEATTFCRSCGYRLQGNEQGVSEEATIRPANLANLPVDADPSDTLKQGPQPVAQVAQPTPVMATPQPQATPGISAYGQAAAAPNPVQPQQAYFAQPVPPAQGGYPPQQQQPVYGQYPVQGGYGTPVPTTPSALTTLQRGFAGKGAPVRHQSWLIENNQVAPQTLNSAFITNLQKQGVMGVAVEHERLREQGVVMEERDYTRVRYGASSVFVYLAPMGQNLYISRTSTIQQPYSKVRMAVLIVLAVLLLLSLICYAVINPAYDPLNPGASGVFDTLKSFFFYSFLGLLFFFIIAALRSLVFWLTDKDFLALLRPNRLNDFSLDALSSIEQTTDKALRATLKDAGLDIEAVQPQVSTPQQALHRF